MRQIRKKMRNKHARNYLGRINLHKATEIEASPIPLKNTQRVRNNNISFTIIENCRGIANKRTMDSIVPIIVNIIPPRIKTRIYSLSTDSNIFSPLWIGYPDMDINFFGGYQ